MPARESEALVLRTYPYREADLIVSFFTRDRGKLRGIARGVRRPKSRFGASLERLSHSRIGYFEKQTLDLVRIDRGELLSPPVLMQADFPTSVALDFIAEVAEDMLPEHEINDAYFRLLTLTVDAVRASLRRPLPPAPNSAAESGGVWPALTYFALWSVRLGGWLPPLDVCLETGEHLPPDQPAWFDRAHDGLLSAESKSADSWLISPQSRALAREMLRKPLSDFADLRWTPSTAADLRRFLNQRLEAHFEKRIKSLQLINDALQALP